MRILACIPARYGSTRFPAKVLARDTGKYLIEHTYNRISDAGSVDQIIIAADDERVLKAAGSFGAECVMTSPDCASGTDRVAQAAADIDCDIVINLQADEPEIDPANIDTLAGLLIDNPTVPMASLAAEFQTQQQVSDPNIVKVIIDNRSRAIYFSRSVIPYDRDAAGTCDVKKYLRHVGVYAYRKEFLLEITKMPQTPLEKTEKLEQLRVIENGFEIVMGKVRHNCDGIDTPGQYKEFVKRYKGQNRV